MGADSIESFEKDLSIGSSLIPSPAPLGKRKDIAQIGARLL
jgi:hypothetical protein